MPRYFFDIDDGENMHLDADGTEFPNEQAAREGAALTIAEMGREVIPHDGGRRDLYIWIRDQSGTAVAKLSLNFKDRPFKR
ncbi:MAG: hypothetical protein JWQ89_221 [Devosia sp.]|uniref:DUF6894 family protein n=1 Tax=Devosia sp. TaxID=1871048 RepID=UPI00260297C0|nr:hypothetical protein [Devosia sp.]MDB5538494.1 hypothetical protein [Devosia sp.]